MKDISTEKKTPSNKDPSQTSFLEKMQEHPFVAAGAGVALIVHLSALLSLPPAIRGRGAPFLPTSKSHGNAMFEQLHHQLLQNSSAKPSSSTRTSALQTKLQNNRLRFVDLGSGDGRLVFRAARAGMFEKSIGYEINPSTYPYT